jgi:agmatinase
MNFPNYFADSESSFKDADFIIFGVPYDKTTTFRSGASSAPDKIRQASWNFETYNIRTGLDFKDIKVHDSGNLDVVKDKPQKMLEKVKYFTSNIVKHGKFPISIGGEHSITSGLIRAFPNNIAVLSLDAHLDFRQEYEGEKNNHACIIRRISEYINLKNIVILGVRSAEKHEYESAKKQGLYFKDAFEIHQNNIMDILKDAERHLNNKKIYLSIDIDVIDPAYAPGSSTPEPFGLLPGEILKIIDFFASGIIGFDLVEVCPQYDKGETAILAAKLIRNLIEQIDKEN